LYPQRFTAEDLTVDILSEEYDLSSFDCSQDDHSGVNEFIHKEALMYQEENMGKTYLFFYGEEIVGFTTISMTHIEQKEAPDSDDLEYFGRKKPPAMLIGQLGVHNRLRGRELGGWLCSWCEGKAIELSGEVGCRYVALHTEQELIPFYEKNGFETTKPNKKSPIMVKKIPNLSKL